MENATSSMLLTVHHRLSPPISILLNESYVLGRQDRGEPGVGEVVIRTDGRAPKFIIATRETVRLPREVVKLTPNVDGTVTVENVHKEHVLELDHRVLGPGEKVALKAPIRFSLLDEFVIRIDSDSPVAEEGYIQSSTMLRVPGESMRPWTADELNADGLAGPDLGAMTLAGQNVGSRMLVSRNSISAQTFLKWLDRAMVAMQSSANSSNFLRSIAEAAAEIIQLDRAVVLMLDRDGQFDILNRENEYLRINDLSRIVAPPSRSLISRAIRSKSLVRFDQTGQRPDTSLAYSLEQSTVTNRIAAVACPILNESMEIIGVLYADRFAGNSNQECGIDAVESKLVELLATSLAQSLARHNSEKRITQYQQFFSPKVAEQIWMNPALLTGEDCEVTVLYCDIRGFSKTTDQLGASRAMEWINDVLEELSQCVLQTDGVVVDYIGDEMMAMWGAPTKIANHAERGVEAAHRIMELADVLSDRWKSEIPDGVKFGIGVNTGMARVGNSGSSTKFKYGPLGPMVNVGSRLQGLTKYFEIDCIVSQRTVSLLPAGIHFRRLTKAKLVGMDQPVMLYQLFDDGSGDRASLTKVYEEALEEFERGAFTDAAMKLSSILSQEQWPDDRPSIILLQRAVDSLARRDTNFSHIWVAPGK